MGEAAGASPDVDRGWAFVIMLCGSTVNALALGLTYMSSIFFTTFLEEFEESASFTAWTVNLNVFTYYLTGELANSLVGVVGPRVTFALGAAVSSAGLLACSFAPSLTWIFVMYGLVAGVGFSLAYFPYFAMVAQYFRRYRVLAFAVSSAGASAGQFVYAPLLRYLIDTYHWRGAFLIVAGINLHFLVVAAAMMPPRAGAGEAGRRLVPPERRGGRGRAAVAQLRQQAAHLRMFLRPRWVLFCVSIMLTNVGISGFFTHITNLAAVLGHGPREAALLPSAIGVGGLVGRLGVGLAAQHPRTHVVGLYLALFAGVGVANIAAGLASDFAGLLATSCVCGVCVGAYALYSETIIHVVGVRLLPHGASYSCVTAAMGMLLGGPIGAWLLEADPSYRLSFVGIGVVALCGALLNVPSWLTCAGGRVRQRRSAEEEEALAALAEAGGRKEGLDGDGDGDGGLPLVTRDASAFEKGP